MNWNACHTHMLGQYAPMPQICSAFLSCSRVVIARLIHPKAMRFEIGCGSNLPERNLPIAPQAGNNFGGQEMRVDDDIPTIVVQQIEKLREIQLLDEQSQAIALRSRPARLVEHVIKESQHMRRFVHQI